MKRVFLIGYMGAGKTTVGKVLSRQLGLSFIDLDHYIEGRYHKSRLLKMSWCRPEAGLPVFSITWSL